MGTNYIHPTNTDNKGSKRGGAKEEEREKEAVEQARLVGCTLNQSDDGRVGSTNEKTDKKQK